MLLFYINNIDNMPVYEGYKSYSRSILIRSDCLKNFMNILQEPFLSIINIINNFYTYTQLRTPMIFLSLRLSKKYFELLQEAFLCNINIKASIGIRSYTCPTFSLIKDINYRNTRTRLGTKKSLPKDVP